MMMMMKLKKYSHTYIIKHVHRSGTWYGATLGIVLFAALLSVFNGNLWLLALNGLVIGPAMIFMEHRNMRGWLEIDDTVGELLVRAEAIADVLQENPEFQGLVDKLLQEKYGAAHD